MSEKELNMVNQQVAQYRKLSSQIDELTRKRDALKRKMVAVMDAYGLERYEGLNYTICYTPCQRTTIDSTALKADHPDIWADYSKITTYTRFTIN